MLDLNRTHSLTSKPVDLSSQKPANPALALDQAITELWSENHKLEGIIQLLCHTEELHLENNGLEGFRNILGGINDAIDKVIECNSFGNPDGHKMSIADQFEAFKEELEGNQLATAHAECIQEASHYASNAFLKVLRENKGKTVGEVMPEAEAAFNRTMNEYCDMAGIPSEYMQDEIELSGHHNMQAENDEAKAIDRAKAVAEAISEAKDAAEAAKPRLRYEDIPLPGNDR